MNFKERETQQKLRGGYYTPLPIAELLSRWVLSHEAKTILEPSCGDGVFLHALYTQALLTAHALPGSIEAVEIVAEEVAKSEAIGARLRALGMDARVIQQDIFSWLSHQSQAEPDQMQKLPPAPGEAMSRARKTMDRVGNTIVERQWDAILGNPPYIRYQYFEKEQRELAEQWFKRAGIPFSKRTNAWVFLVLACILHLKPGGSLALVLPAELLYIQHAGGLRRLLEQEMATITLINIREMVFPDALQGVVLLLARKKCAGKPQALALKPAHPPTPSASTAQTNENIVQSASIRLLDLDNVAEVCALSLDQLEGRAQHINDTRGEWMFGLLSDEEAKLVSRLRAHPGVQPFASIASVDIGIVTGANNFFVVDRATLERFELASIASPMLAKSDLIKGVTYTRRDHEANEEAGKAVFFLRFPARASADLPAPMAAYIASGEARQLHRRYKCRIRQPWYVVPYVWTAEMALLKRCHLFPRLIINELGAHSTDTAYRIRLHASTAGRASDLAFSFLNSLTFLCAELGGRHYGGGVLELVPSEIERLLVPLQRVHAQTFARVDAMLRSHASLDELLVVTDPLILGQGLGLTPQEILTLQAAHRRLLKRRLRI
jgi:adenine-specific DNA methylase